MKDYTNYYGSSKEKILNDGKKIFNLNLQGFDAVEVQINGELRKIIITEKYSAKEELRKVIDEHSRIKVGDTILYSGKQWLVRKIDSENPVFDTATIEFTPSSLRWLNESGEIEEFYFIFNSDNLSNFGVEDGRTVSIPNDRRNISIKNNEISQRIRIGQRFIFDQSAWKVISINRLSPLLEIVLESDLIDTVNDNVLERIADYDNAANYILVILNGKMQSIQRNQSLQLNVELKNRDKIVDNPELIYEVEDSSIVTVNDNGLIHPVVEGSTYVKVKYKDTITEIQINVVPSIIHNYTATITGEDVIKYNMCKTYQVQFFDNGEIRKDTSSFLLTSEDGKTPTTLAHIEVDDSQNNSCIIRAGDKPGYAILHAENSNQLIHTSKKIRIKSLL